MKTLVASVSLLFVLLSLSGCSRFMIHGDPTVNSSDEESIIENTTMRNDTQPLPFVQKKYEDFFDYDMKNKPNKADIEKLQTGMQFDSVITLIGKPHGVPSGPSVAGYFWWVTVEGEEYILRFTLSDNTPLGAESEDQFSPYVFHHSILSSIRAKVPIIED